MGVLAPRPMFLGDRLWIFNCPNQSPLNPMPQTQWTRPMSNTISNFPPNTHMSNLPTSSETSRHFYPPPKQDLGPNTHQMLNSNAHQMLGPNAHRMMSHLGHSPQFGPQIFPHQSLATNSALNMTNWNKPPESNVMRYDYANNLKCKVPFSIGNKNIQYSSEDPLVPTVNIMPSTILESEKDVTSIIDDDVQNRVENNLSV